MSFAAAIPFSGVAGWAFLKRTGSGQMQRLAASGEMQRDAAYFRDRIAGAKTAEALVADRRLLKVALGAFGLSADIDSKYFIRKVLEDGFLSPDALANKLSDKRYLQLAKTFGYGDFAVPSTQLSDFADQILGRYQVQSYEAAVGNQDNALRLAMTAERELPGLAGSARSVEGGWYAIMASPPLRQVVQTAFGFPPSFVGVDIDQQLGALKDAAQRYLGTPAPADFADGAVREKLIRLFLVRSEAGETAAANGQNAALALLRGGPQRGLSLRL